MANVLLQSNVAGGMRFTQWRIQAGSGTEVLKGLGVTQVIGCFHVWESGGPDNPTYVVNTLNGEITVGGIANPSTGIVTAVSR